MALIYYRKFDPSMQFLNPNVFFVYVESVNKKGGTHDVIQLRNARCGLSLTLVDTYLQEDSVGCLQSETAERDIKTVETEFQKINYVLHREGIVCLPSMIIQDRITSLEKSSPKMAGYTLKRFNHLTSNHSPHQIELP